MNTSDQYYSPLRYPGGKASLSDFLVRVLQHNEINYGTYVEGFAGGAGAALKLLMLEYVDQIYLNDKDIFISSFWDSVLKQTDELCKKIYDSSPNFSTWQHYHKIILESAIYKDQLSTLDLGYIGFFMNRINRSGILKGGPIGGTEQRGIWKMDARFNKENLIKRIQKIALYNERIHISNLDVIDFLKGFSEKEDYDGNNTLFYLDPPYVLQGKQLYRHYFKEADHRSLGDFLRNNFSGNWIVSYDDHPLIHEIYNEEVRNFFEFNYFAHQTKIGKELVICRESFLLPNRYKQYSKVKKLQRDIAH